MKKKHYLNLKNTLLALLLPVLSIPFALFGTMLPVAAASGTYANLNIDAQIQAFEYYALLTNTSNTNSCVPNGVIQNGDIANYKFFANDGQGAAPTYDTGSGVKNTRDFNCTDQTAISGALKAVGINATDPGEALCQLGYTQTESKSSKITSCGKNAKTKTTNDTFELSKATSFDQVNARYPIVTNAILKNSTVFAGTAPTWTDAMLYESSLNDFIHLCSASAVKGATYNITDSANIGVVDAGGKIISQLWSYTNNSDINYFILNAGGNSKQTCAGVAANLKSTTSKYILAYQKYTYVDACKTGYPANANDSAFINGCVLGVSNPTNYVLCSNLPTAGYVGSTLQSDERNACFLGQNVGVDTNGTSSGELCMNLGYKTDPALTACINGAINRATPTYCTTTYYTGYHGSTFENHDAEAAACKDGSKLVVAVGGSVVVKPTNQSNTSGLVNASTCVVDGIGWIVCPMMNAIGGLSDALYAWVQSVLVLNPLTQNNPDGTATPQYTNWSIMRNIANVLLVIAFLFIIFSQISSVGISNYGVKKMLPRVILIAVAINLSWIILSASIDIVNIVGVGLRPLLDSATSSVSSQTLNSPTVFSDLTGGLLIGTAGVAGLATVGLITAGASTLVLMAVPFVVGALLALLAAVATLFLRNAIVIVLVIIGPVALAAYLLPNTEEYFKKWRKMFTSMLFLFPIAALLFSGAKLAAYIIATSNQPFATIIAIFVMAAPLGMLPWLARSSGGILASVNKQLGSMAKGVQNATQKGLAARVQAGKDERRANTRNWLGGKRDPNKLRAAGTGQTYENDGAHYQRGEDGKLHQTPHKAGDLMVDKEGVALKKKVRRTMAGTFSDWNKGFETRSETAKKAAGSNFQERGLGDGPGAAKVAAIVDASKVEGLRGESIEAQYKARLEVNKLQSGQTRDIYDRLQDANATTSALEHEQTLRQKSRLQGNTTNTVAGAVGISRLATVEGDAVSFIDAPQAERLRALGNGDDIDLTGGGGLKILHEVQETAELHTQRIDKQLENEFEKRKAPGGNLANVQAQIDRSELSTENAKNAQQSARENSKLPDGENSDLFAESIVGKAASDKTAAEQRRIEFEARLGVNQQRRDGSQLFTQETATDENGDEQLVGGQLADIRDSDQDTQASSEAASYAEGGRTIKYAAAIDKGLTEGDERGRALAVAASGASEKNIDGSQNYEQAKDADGNLLFEKDADGKDTDVPILDTTKPKVAILTEAKAAKTVLEDKQSDQNTIVSLAKSRSMPGGEALAYLGVDSRGYQLKDENGDIKGAPDIPDAQKLGYIRYAAGRGDRQTSMALVSHVGELGRQANEARERVKQAEEAGKTPLKADQDIIRHAKEAQAVLLEAGDSSLPPWMGGSDRQKLAEGTFTGSVEENAFGAVATGKLTADAFAGMDIKNRDTFVSALNQMTTASPEQTARLAGTIKDYDNLAKADQKIAIDDAALEENLRTSAASLVDNYKTLTPDEQKAAIDRVMPTVRQNFAQAVVPIEKAQFDDRINRGLAPRDIQRYDRMRERLLHVAAGRKPVGEDGKEFKPRGKVYRGPLGADYDDAGINDVQP